MTAAVSIDLQQWLQTPTEWNWNAEKEDAKEEDDWANAFEGVFPKGEKGENPFELFVGAMMAIGAVLNGNDQDRDGEKSQKPACGMESQAANLDKSHSIRMVHQDIQTLEVVQKQGLPGPTLLPMRDPFPAIIEDMNSPSRQLLNKMLGMSTLSFSKMPAEADPTQVTEITEPSISPAHGLKRQRTVSFSELPEIHHVESFKDMSELWDPAYLTPQPAPTQLWQI